MLLNYTKEITILYNGGCRNTHFESKTSGGSDKQNRLNKVKIKRIYILSNLVPRLLRGNKFYNSSQYRTSSYRGAPKFLSGLNHVSSG